MSKTPDDRRYSKEHEWVLREGERARIGITDYAQDQLGDVVYVDLPEVGATLEQFAKMGEIESVKAVSDLFAPVSGEVIAINDALADQPELVNSDPYGQGWLVEVRPAENTQLELLLDAPAYEAFTAAEGTDEAMKP